MSTKVAKDSNYKKVANCALLTSAWYFMVPTTLGFSHLGAILLSNPIYLNLGGKCQGANSQRFGRLAIKTVPTSPRFGSCKVTSFDKNAGQIRTHQSSHWQHMTAWSQLKAFNSLASSWVLASSNSSLVSITSIIVWLSWSDSHVRIRIRDSSTDKTAWNLKFHHCSMFVAWCERLSQNASL